MSDEENNNYNEMLGKEIEKKYKLIKLLGIGLYGAVFKAKKLTSKDEEYFAIKCIPKKLISLQAFNNI